jgi:zinc protease
MRARAAWVAALAASCALHGADWRQIPIPPLRPFQAQHPKRIALPNGMVVFLQEDHELPLVQGMARLRGGSRDEPAEKVGLVALFGEVWRTGGTTDRTGDELDDFLEARAAKVETAGDEDSTWITFSCLRGDLEEVFQAFAEVLRRPAFRAEKVELAKTQLRTEISRRNDHLSQIASREATKLAYGAASPYARVPEYRTVNAITREDLVAWHTAHAHPNHLYLGIVGDFDSTALEARLRRAFADWPRGPELAARPPPIHEPEPGVYFVAKDDVNQSAIRMVHLGIARRHPDFYAVQVLNEILGGGMGSRLFRRVRSGKGLAYHVGGGVGVEYDHPGIARLTVGTKSRSTVAAIRALFEELDSIQRAPPDPEELRRAQENLLNSFIFRYDTRAKVLRQRLTFEFHGLPADLLERYPGEIARVRADDVLRAARTHLSKERLRLLVVGKAADFDAPLTSVGAVKTIDITIPPP